MASDSSVQQLTVRAPGDRTLDVQVSGPPDAADGMALVFHTGTPSGLVGLGPMARAAQARGLRTVLYGRRRHGGPPPRCLAAASIAGVAPSDSPGLDWLAGMGEENLEEFAAAQAGEADLTTFLNAAAEGL